MVSPKRGSAHRGPRTHAWRRLELRPIHETAGGRYFARTKDLSSAGRVRKSHERKQGQFGRGHPFLHPLPQRRAMPGAGHAQPGGPHTII
jgi:hypothetical protein